MVFQSFNLFPHRTALENVMEGPVYVLGLTAARAEERARRSWAGSGFLSVCAMPRELSGGQQRRVAIAPPAWNLKVILLHDEPNDLPSTREIDSREIASPS